jgi:hypothetical protein
MNAKTTKTQEQNLIAACQEAREALANAAQNDALARYKVGAIACKVKDDAKYGANALEQLEAELGLDDKTLYRYAKVAEAWTEAEFKETSKLLNARGLPLTWSHYELIAKIADDEARDALTKRVLEACHTSRALRVEMMASKVESQEAKSETKKGTPKAAIMAFASLVKTIGSVSRDAVVCERKSLPGLKASRAKLPKKDHARLREARKRMEEIKAIFDRLAHEVDDVLDSPRELTSTVTADAA